MSTDASQDGNNRQSDLAVMDANEYKQKRRLQRILDAHDNVEEQANTAYEAYIEAVISEDAKNIMIRRAVQQFIRESYNLLSEYVRYLPEDDEEADEYWDRTHLVKQNGNRALGKIEMEHGEDVVFYGLADVLYADDFYIEKWEEPVEQRHGQDLTEEKSRSYSVPEEVSWNGFLLLKEFLSEEKDMEIRFEELNEQRPFSDWRGDR